MRVPRHFDWHSEGPRIKSEHLELNHFLFRSGKINSAADCDVDFVVAILGQP